MAGVRRRGGYYANENEIRAIQDGCLGFPVVIDCHYRPISGRDIVLYVGIPLVGLASRQGRTTLRIFANGTNHYDSIYFSGSAPAGSLHSPDPVAFKQAVISNIDEITKERRKLLEVFSESCFNYKACDICR